MLVVLSQRIDFESGYADELFKTYHYPSRYRNQLHEGDKFIYYQGNRYDRKQRYYFGTGVVSQISAADEKNYYATLDRCKRFSQKVPIYLPDGGYIEQLNYQEVRKNINPPWQSSIRPISEQAYNYVLSRAGSLKNVEPALSLEEMKSHLKQSIRDFFVGKDNLAVLEIGNAAATIAKALNLSECQAPDAGSMSADYNTLQISPDPVGNLISYCLSMKMSYSYKPVLIMALLELHDKDWNLSISKAAQYFKTHYQQRREKGLPVELKKCIYQDPSVTLEAIIKNLISNPVKVLVESGFFEYTSDTCLFSLRSDLKKKLTKKDIEGIYDVCKRRLDQYYSRQRF